MKTSNSLFTIVVTLTGLSSASALAQATGGTPEAEAALLERAKAFAAAFDKGDAQAVAGFWTPDGDYTDQTGRHMKGREAIEKEFAEFFTDNKDLKLRIDIDSLRFVTADVAIEDGVTSVISPDGSPPSRARYTIVHVKKDGKWYLDSVRDAAFAPSGNYENLRRLAWIIGDWSDEAKDGESSRVSFQWAEGQNFIVGSYATVLKGSTLGGGKEWIGWDPLAKRVRSWMFDLEGGFGEGAWSIERDKLVIKTISVTQDGKKVTATNIVTRVDADTVMWQSKERTADGKPMPDTKEVKMKRLSE